jgi:hypothetical protein
MFLLSQEHTDPAIVSIWPDAIPLSMHPATNVHVKIFAFIPPSNSQTPIECKLLLIVRSGSRPFLGNAFSATCSGSRLLPCSYFAVGSGIALTPTRARYSSACKRSSPARSTIFSRLSIDETSSSCSVKNHCKKLIVM